MSDASKRCDGSGESRSRLLSYGQPYKCADGVYRVACSCCGRELRPLKHPGSIHFFVVPFHKPTPERAAKQEAEHQRLVAFFRGDRK